MLLRILESATEPLGASMLYDIGSAPSDKRSCQFVPLELFGGLASHASGLKEYVDA